MGRFVICSIYEIASLAQEIVSIADENNYDPTKNAPLNDCLTYNH